MIVWRCVVCGHEGAGRKGDAEGVRLPRRHRAPGAATLCPGGSRAAVKVIADRPRRVSLKPPGDGDREADVLPRVRAWLEGRGWFVLRTYPGRWITIQQFLGAWNSHDKRRRHPPGGKPPVFGRTLHEPSMPDLVALRAVRAGDQALFVEVKKPGGRPTREQEEYHYELRKRGFRVFWVDGVDTGEEPLTRLYERAFPDG